MMRKSLLVFAIASAVSVSAPAKPGKNTPDALATITAGGCENVQIAPFGTSLLASWEWSNGTIQSKFGGDAVYQVDAGTTESEPEKFEVEFELVQYAPGTLAEDYPGQLVYRCSNAPTDDVGSCNASILGLRSALREAAADYLGVAPEEVEFGSATLDGVYVKAMNPGPGNGRQNYPLVDVCDVEITAP
jgi:hypothetical protein